MSKGKFGIHGGQFIPETLMSAVAELAEAYEHYKNDPQFMAELDQLLKEYCGRPSRLYFAEKMTKDQMCIRDRRSPARRSQRSSGGRGPRTGRTL